MAGMVVSSSSFVRLSVIVLVSLWKSTDGFFIRPRSTTIRTSYSPSLIDVRRNSNIGKAYLASEKGSSDDFDGMVKDEDETSVIMSRRSMIGISSMSLSGVMMIPSVAMATTADDATSGVDTTVTNKIFLNLKGLASSAAVVEDDQIVIGLYGKAAPNSVGILMAICDEEHGGYDAPCKPKDETRTLQKDQLEASKVYNACIESLESSTKKGVTYDLSTVWRVIPNERIDFGAVQGKFISRVPPNFQETTTNTLKHDAPGVVSVRRGDDGGFGFTIYPGNGDHKTLDESHIVVGRVLEGMDVIQKLNQVPIVKSASAFTGGPRAAPSRACRYGSTELFCNEYKPLKKILITKTGIMP